MKRILILLCDHALRTILERRYRREGFEVLAVETIEEMNRRAAGFKPNLLLLDLGCEYSADRLMKFVKSQPLFQSAKVFFYSEQLLQDEVELIAKKEVDAVFIGSHISIKELIDYSEEELKA